MNDVWLFLVGAIVGALLICLVLGSWLAWIYFHDD